MIRPLTMLIAALLMAAPAAAQDAVADRVASRAADQTAQPAVDPGGYRYLRFLPAGYGASAARWPLMIFLHGSGERGDDIDRVAVNGPPRVVTAQPDFPFVTISPQLPADADWDVATLTRLLDHAVATLRIDPARIYLTGLSRGGHATWRWAAAAPDRFAAIVPVAGRADPSQACRLKDMPIWSFHGDRDTVVTPFSNFAMVEAIRSCGGSPRLTIYPDTGHDSWTPAYADPALYRWLLDQRRPAPTD